MQHIQMKMPDGKIVEAEVIALTTTLDAAHILAHHRGEFFSFERRIGSPDYHLTWKQRAS